MVATNRVQPRKRGESDKAITRRIHTNNEPAIDFTKEHIIGGWRPGMDPRVDYSGHFEFGGSLGCLALMTGFPLLMWYMWIGATYYDGKLPLPENGQSWSTRAPFPISEHGAFTGPISFLKPRAMSSCRDLPAMENLFFIWVGNS